MSDNENSPLLALVRRETESLWSEAREAYFEAVQTKVISMLILLAKTEKKDTAGWLWQGIHEGKQLAIRVSPDLTITAKWGDCPLLSNEKPGEEFLILHGGHWLTFCADQLRAIEAAKAKLRTDAENARRAQEALKELADQDEAVRILSVMPER